MRQIFERIHTDTGMAEFEAYGENQDMMPFADFVNSNKQIALEALARISQNEREEL